MPAAVTAQAAGFGGAAPDYALLGAPGQKQYTGQRITLEFHDIDVRNLLRLLADVSKKNMVVADDVTGKITVCAAQRALGPGPRHRPPVQGAREAGGRQRHPDRQVRGHRQGGGGQARGAEEPPDPAPPQGPHHPGQLLDRRRPGPPGEGRPHRPRHGHHRRADQRPHREGHPGCPGTGRGAGSQPRHRDPGRAHREPHRRGQLQLHPGARRPVGRQLRIQPRHRQRAPRLLPQRDDRDRGVRTRRPTRGTSPRPTTPSTCRPPSARAREAASASSSAPPTAPST